VEGKAAGGRVQVGIQFGANHERVWRRRDGLAEPQVRPLRAVVYCLPPASLPIILRLLLVVRGGMPGCWPPLHAIQEVLAQIVRVAVKASKSRGCPAARQWLRVQAEPRKRVPRRPRLAVWQPKEQQLS
jgi:hypothetical protein